MILCTNCVSKIVWMRDFSIQWKRSLYSHNDYVTNKNNKNTTLPMFYLSVAGCMERSSSITHEIDECTVFSLFAKFFKRFLRICPNQKDPPTLSPKIFLVLANKIIKKSLELPYIGTAIILFVIDRERMSQCFLIHNNIPSILTLFYDPMAIIDKLTRRL